MNKMLLELGINAKEAENTMRTITTDQKNQVLAAVAGHLVESTDKLLEANAVDVANAKQNHMPEGLVDRLMLSPERIEGMAEGLRQLVALEDPIGEVTGMKKRPNGLLIGQKRVPLGVVGIIYEARPNVTADAFGLCFKTGNVVILKGGSDAIHSNAAIVDCIRESLKACGVTENAIQLIADTSRETAAEFMKMNEYVDVLIPRGGKGLIKAVVENATVPVIETGSGNCHIYIDESADIDMAVSVTNNGKTQRPSVCNALETCLVHKSAAKEFLPKLMDEFKKFDVDVRGCDRTRGILGDGIKKATELDYATEFDDYIMAVKVVDDIDEAIEHISKYSTGHSECIITNNLKNAEKFQREIDSACVYVNCSTRFTDGGEFGFGAEIGISTQRLHARGPMGLRELTTMKYLINGDGQIRK